MTKYICWPVEIDASFRPAYLAATGEQIQENPLINVDGTLYLVGSSRLTEKQSQILIAEFQNLYIGDSPPPYWHQAN